MAFETTIDTVRARPGMYVGDTYDGTGLVNMFWDVVGNALDQHLAGRCNRIEVVLHERGVSVKDDGPGIPREVLEEALTRFHNRATLDGHAWHVHLGSGTGLLPVAALSTVFEIESCHAGKIHHWRLEKGSPIGSIVTRDADRATGTSIRFEPDATIFGTSEIPREPVYGGLRNVADLTPGLEILLRDEGRVLRSPGGLVDRLRRFAPLARHVVLATETIGDGSVQVALGWQPTPHEPHCEGFVNMNFTRDGGTHVAGLRRAARSFGRTAHERARIERQLVGIVSVMLPDVKYGSPTKDKLVSPAAGTLTRGVVTRMLRAYFVGNPEVLREIRGR